MNASPMNREKPKLKYSLMVWCSNYTSPVCALRRLSTDDTPLNLAGVDVLSVPSDDY